MGMFHRMPTLVTRAANIPVKRPAACFATVRGTPRTGEIGSRLLDIQAKNIGLGTKKTLDSDHYLEPVTDRSMALPTSSENSMVELESELVGEMAAALCRTEDRLTAALRAMREVEDQFPPKWKGAPPPSQIHEFNAARHEAVEKRRELLIHRQAAGFVRGNWELVRSSTCRPAPVASLHSCRGTHGPELRPCSHSLPLHTSMICTRQVMELFPIGERLDLEGTPVVVVDTRDEVRRVAREKNEKRVKEMEERAAASGTKSACEQSDVSFPQQVLWK